MLEVELSEFKWSGMTVVWIGFELKLVQEHCKAVNWRTPLGCQMQTPTFRVYNLESQLAIGASSTCMVSPSELKMHDFRGEWICQGELIGKFIHRLNWRWSNHRLDNWWKQCQQKRLQWNWQSLQSQISYNPVKYPRPGTDFTLSPESCLDVDRLFPPTLTAEDFEELLGWRDCWYAKVETDKVDLLKQTACASKYDFPKGNAFSHPCFPGSMLVTSCKCWIYGPNTLWWWQPHVLIYHRRKLEKS